MQSLIEAGVPLDRMVVVDNGSIDGTQDYLRDIDLGQVIFNRENLSCGAAWNQGILALQKEWTIVMNNDIVVTKDFATRLIEYATKHQLKLVSPARIDGVLNYDFDGFADDAQQKMGAAVRLNSSNAICMCIHWSLFKEIGFFRADPKLLGFEDGLFYNEIRKFKIPHATTGSVWIHHFGQVTQDHMKMVLGIKSQDTLVKVNDRKLYQQSWIERKWFRHRMKTLHRQWRASEIERFGMSLHGSRSDESFLWL
jgi:glycosyltransferase involved in cell wall biosynthesis